MCMNWVINILCLILDKFEMANLNLDDDLVPCFSFFHFFPSGREEIISSMSEKNPFMCMNCMINILLCLILVKFEMANLNLDDDLVPFFSFFHFFPNGSEESISSMLEKNPWKKHAKPGFVCS